MIKRIARILAAIIGFAIGFQLISEGPIITAMSLAGVAVTSEAATFSISIFSGSVVGIIFYIITPWFFKRIIRFTSWVEGALKVIPTQDIALIIFGLFTGLIFGALSSIVLRQVPLVGNYLSLITTVVFAYLGVNLVNARKEEMSFITNLFNRHSKASGRGIKILDTSVIIDGRIMDICSTGFIEGVLVIPGFVLEELQHIADSSDLLKRNRGRRGLDILNKIQKDMIIPVQIVDEDFEEISEVDSKLVKLAKKLKGQILTNDYNLNKVCELQSVQVLNINELANAVKPIVLPGEEISVQIVKDGKEQGQGVAYLDDGTMIVVEGGRRYIGTNKVVVVTSVLQTAAGRMIFAKPKTTGVEKTVTGVK